MARTTRIVASTTSDVVLRLAEPELGELLTLMECRYPDFEWVSFIKLGWRHTPSALVLTLAGVDAPGQGDVDQTVGHVAIDEQFSLRVALSADHHPLAIGIVHSHPRNCPPIPSPTDDDMDSYYASYFESFAPNRPYVSLITSRIHEELAVSGRVWWNGSWHVVKRVVLDRRPVRQWVGGHPPASAPPAPERLARVTSAYGASATERLRRATVAVIGAGGTGSAAVEVLARGGVGRIVIVDPDTVDESNLERLHGATSSDVGRAKAAVAKAHVQSIDHECEVIAIRGAIPQDAVVDIVATADVMLGCSDQQHSRVALSDIATRYLVPAIDCGVGLEGRNGRVTGQIVQLVRFQPADPCVYCKSMVDPVRLSQELASPEERDTRRRAAREAGAVGGDANPYWREVPQLNTVGFLTTSAGAMAAGYAMGWITGRYAPPFQRIQFNLLSPFLDVTDSDTAPDPACSCRRSRGWADQGASDAFVTAPPHWTQAEFV